MCGRYSFSASPEQLNARYELPQPALALEPRYNVAPTQTMPVVLSQEGERQAELMRWGLIPFFTKELAKAKPLINARAETLGAKPSFRRALAARRCLVPATGFYEWRKDGSKGSTPFYVYCRDQAIFSFAGLYDLVKDAQGQWLKTYTIITTGPNDLMAPIHNRMPVILTREDEHAWLQSPSDAPGLLDLLRPYPAELMAAHVVSRRVNSPASQGADLIQPAS